MGWLYLAINRHADMIIPFPFCFSNVQELTNKYL